MMIELEDRKVKQWIQQLLDNGEITPNEYEEYNKDLKSASQWMDEDDYHFWKNNDE